VLLIKRFCYIISSEAVFGMKIPDFLESEKKPSPGQKLDQKLDQASNFLGWLMTALLAVLAGHSMSLGADGLISVSGSGTADLLIMEAIILCPATAIRWWVRMLLSLTIAIIL